MVANSTDNLVNGQSLTSSTGKEYSSFANGAFTHPEVVFPSSNGQIVPVDSKVKSPSLSGEDDFDPLREEVPDNERTNYGQTLMNLMNGIIGSGVLSMPIAFLNGGWLVASIVTPIIGLISCYCIHLLLQVNVHLTKVTGKVSPYDYHEMAEYAFLLGPKRFRRFSKLARLAVIGTIVCTQVGACCVYYVFIATNFRVFLVHRLPANHVPSEAITLVMILPVVIAINWIRNIRYLSYLSTLANVLQVAGISVVLYNLFSMPMHDVRELPAVGAKIPQYFVTTLFIFEGSSVSMSLYKAIKNERHFRMPCGVLNVGESMIMFFYSGVGFLGYLQYGAETEGTITASLPAKPLYDAVQLSYAIVVLGTYPILLYVPIQVIWGILKRKIAHRLTGSAQMLIAELAFRSGLVIITYLLSVVVPKLDLIIAVVGAVTSSSIAVIIPSILHTVTFWEHRPGRLAKGRLLAVNLVLFLIGISAFVIGFYFSLGDIINSYKHPHPQPPPGNGTTNGTLTFEMTNFPQRLL